MKANCKIIFLLQISLLCLIFCSCSRLTDNAKDTVEQIIQAANSENIKLINELAPFTKKLGIEDQKALLIFWKDIAEKNHKVEVVKKSVDTVFVKVTVMTEYKSTIASYIFECKKDDGKYILLPDYKIDSSKRTIDYIELKDLEKKD